MLPEQRLWNSWLQVTVEDAIFPFQIDQPLGDQYKKMSSPLHKKIIITWQKDLIISKAINTLESGMLDFAVEACGNDTNYTRRLCDFINQALEYKQALIKKGVIQLEKPNIKNKQ